MTTGGESQTGRDRRVLVQFGEHELCAYRADALAAERYVEAMGECFPGLRVTVDDDLAPELRRLPSELLWSLAP